MTTEQTVGYKPTSDNQPDNLIYTNDTIGKKPKKGGFKDNFRKYGAYYLMLLPGIIVLIINNYMPMIGIIIPFEDYKFKDNFFKSLFTSDFVGLKNFRFLFSSVDVINATRNTVLYNLVFITLDLVVPVALAIAVSELWSKKAGNFYQTAIFLPYFISWIAVSYIVYAFFSNQTGFVDNTILKLFGISNIDFYSEPGRWPFILTFFHLWKYTGYNLIVYIAALSGISNDYYEAAALDGATKWQQIKYITLPMLKTTMVVLTLIAVGRIFNGDFDLFYNVPRNTGALYATTDVLDTYVFRLLQNLGNVGMSAAAGIYQAVVGCIIVFIANFAVNKVDKDSALF